MSQTTRRFTATALLFLAWGGAARAQAQEQKGADVPLKRVVLFNSGVGFFERRAEIEGDARLDLRFNVDDVNDLLKSMVVQDLGGGRISTVTYGSRDPITKTLKTFAIDLTSNPTLGELLSQVRGEQVEIEAPNKIVGTILGLERRRQRAGEKEVVEAEYLNLLTSDGLRSVALAGVVRIKLVNEKLDGELRQALTLLALGHDTDKKTVTLNFTGKQKRPVRVGYIQETPVWKTSYRLVLADDAPPFLQGWAIVENTTEEDWSNVDLTLISGRPISFIMDLYQPLYVQRPVVEPELYASLRPQEYEQDLAGKDADFRRMARGEGKGERMDKLKELQVESLAKRQAAPLADAKAAAGFGAFQPGQGVESVAHAGDVGELFQYALEAPVSLARQRSAMLPIVNESVKGEKLSIYNARVHAKHPLNGLELQNSTELHLMQGPITVFDGGAYAGDAKIQDLQPGGKRLISYAMDLDTEVAPESKGTPDELITVKSVKGVLEVTTKHRRSVGYTIKNSSRKPKKVLIEQPIDTAWTLVAPKSPTEKTRDMYRFAVDAQPGVPATLSVEEERTGVQHLALSNLDDNAIRFYIARPIVSAALKEALANVIKQKTAILDLLAQRQRLEAAINVIFQDQTRIRANMAALDRTSDQYIRYVKKFGEQEDQLEKLRADALKLVEDEAKLRKALDAYLVNLNLG